MKNEKNLPGSIIASTDQAIAAVEAMASVVTAYYKGLIDSGMPPEVAAKLTADFSLAQIFKLFGMIPGSNEK